VPQPQSSEEPKVEEAAKPSDVHEAQVEREGQSESQTTENKETKDESS
jgi:hypothetical protein